MIVDSLKSNVYDMIAQMFFYDMIQDDKNSKIEHLQNLRLQLIVRKKNQYIKIMIWFMKFTKFRPRG